MEKRMKGLKSFFDLPENSKLRQAHRLHDTTVIIDGNNIVFYLYVNHFKLDPIYGGDYVTFSTKLREIFDSFQKCHITPIIVFTGNNFKSLKESADMTPKVQRLEAANHAASYGISLKRYPSKQLLPTFAFDVFRDVANEMEITMKSDFEHENKILTLAGMAHRYQCPIISENCEYYIADIANGFIPIQTLQFEIDTFSDIDRQGRVNYLSCQIFFQHGLLPAYSVDKSLLPLFGAMLKEDCIRKIFNDRESLIGVYAPFSDVVPIILKWLENKSESVALAELNELLKHEERSEIMNFVNNSSMQYKDISSNILLPYINTTNKLRFSCGRALPIWFVTNVKNAKFPSFFLTAIVHRKHFLSSQIEDFGSDSSHMCSINIRKALYGILLRHNSNSTKCTNEICSSDVEEYDRHNKKELSSKRVDILNNSFELPTLDKIYNISGTESLDIMEKVLDEDLSNLSDLPYDWRLLIACMRYWSKTSNNPWLEQLVSALILNLIHCNFLRDVNVKSVPLTHSMSSLIRSISPSMIKHAKYMFDVTKPKQSKEMMKNSRNNMSETIVGTRPKLSKETIEHLRNHINETFVSTKPKQSKEMIKHSINNMNEMFFGTKPKQSKEMIKHSRNNMNEMCVGTKPKLSPEFGILHGFCELNSCLQYAMYLNKLLNCPLENTKLHTWYDGKLLYNLAVRLIESNVSLHETVSQLLGETSALFCIFKILKAKVKSSPKAYEVDIYI